jgi:hypothetical protein
MTVNGFAIHTLIHVNPFGSLSVDIIQESLFYVNPNPPEIKREFNLVGKFTCFLSDHEQKEKSFLFCKNTRNLI